MFLVAFPCVLPRQLPLLLGGAVDVDLQCRDILKGKDKKEEGMEQSNHCLTLID